MGGCEWVREDEVGEGEWMDRRHGAQEGREAGMGRDAHLRHVCSDLERRSIGGDCYSDGCASNQSGALKTGPGRGKAAQHPL